MAAENSSDQRPVIQASDILAKIERGEDVEYDGVIVEGNLDISGLKLDTKHTERAECAIVFFKMLGWTDAIKIINSRIKIRNSEINGNVNFMNINFQDAISFVGAKFGGDANFMGVEFSMHADFRKTEFSMDADFRGAKFGYSNFTAAVFGWDAYFACAEFAGDVDFTKVVFKHIANFAIAKFNGRDNNFTRVQFSGEKANFEGAEFSGNLSFKDTKFCDSKSQEIACRIAKRKMEDLGNKNNADYYFYREMEAIRIQNGIKGIEKIYQTHPSNIKEWLTFFRSKILRIKSKIKKFIIYDILEYIFIQRVFGYGVRPFNVAKAWLSVVFFLGVVYWAGAGVVRGDEPLEWYEYFYFSIVTAATPGYAGYTPATGFYTLIAGAQAIFGTFMWAAFIATFARKWQR